jgi:hypothetical protein
MTAPAIHIGWDVAYSVDRSAVIVARRTGPAYEVLSAFHFPPRHPFENQARTLAEHVRDLHRRLVVRGVDSLEETLFGSQQRWRDAGGITFVVRSDATNELAIAQKLAQQLARIPYVAAFEPVHWVGGNVAPHLASAEKENHYLRRTIVGKEWSDSDLLAKVTQRLITGGPSVRHVMDELAHYRVTRSAAGNPISGAEAGWSDDYVSALKLATLGEHPAQEESVADLALGGRDLPPELDDGFRPAERGESWREGW